jgi:signal transduction histidine kinase/CheY-like chemotaxis protein/CHASE3 domain sensor protein/HPt (histidine-containing phosphotransfer) domain-containing protein
MRTISVQIRIGLLLFLAVILLLGACFLSYRNISAVINSFRKEISPEVKLLDIRDISADLDIAGNSIRIYLFSRDSADVKPYYTVLERINDKLDKFHEDCRNDTLLSGKADTLRMLIEDNFNIWNEIIYLINNDKVIDHLEKLSNQSAVTSTGKDRKGFFSRIFQRPRKEIPDKTELLNRVKEIEKQGKLNQEKLKGEVSQLAVLNNKIREEFYALTMNIENRISAEMTKSRISAGKIAHRTYQWLMLFSVSSGLLVILVMFIIIRYIKRAHDYQVALERSKTETETLARTKELFLANISHEIRTPVTAISGFAEQLIMDVKDEDTVNTLQIIKSSANHLARIIDDILDISRLRSGKLKLENVHFNIEYILNEVWTIFNQQALNNKTSLTFFIDPDIPHVIIGDPARFKQILINLVGNSVKFTLNGRVSFSVGGSLQDKENMDLIIQVIDNGIGIDEDKLKYVFDEFVQAENSISRQYGGTGLGLSIVKNLVDLHNGIIECESRRYHGTKVTIHIPYPVGSEKLITRNPVLPVTPPAELGELNILIVDDEKYNRMLLRKIFERWKIKCQEATMGMEAIELLRNSVFDIVFMDIRMPGLDGIRTTHFIRDELKLSESDLKIICITATPLNENWVKYQQAGMNGFIQKPFSEEELLKTIVAVKKIYPLQATQKKDPLKEKIRNAPPKVSLENLRHISGGDIQFIKQMLESFIFSTQKGIRDINDALAHGNMELVSGIAHRLLPPCRHLGATELHDLLSRIEEQSQQKTDVESLERIVLIAENEFQLVKSELTTYLSKLK